MIQNDYFGIGSIQRVTSIIDKEKAVKIFLVTGKKSFELSGAKEKLDKILIDCQICQFDQFSENPKYEDVEVGIQLFKKNNPDIVIAVGGGSAIDMAKLISSLAVQCGNSLDYIQGRLKAESRQVPLVAIPTTSGSGSEVTHFAVVYYRKKKFSLADQSILPNYAIYDPELTYTMSRELTATTGLDALSQSIEAYWSVDSTKLSQKYSHEALELALKNLTTVVNHPTPDSRIAMAKAAHLAGKAINIAKTTACHALSYTLTSCFGIPHGLAVALTLGSLLVFNEHVTERDLSDKRGVRHIKTVIGNINRLFGSSNSMETKDRIEQLIESVGYSTKLHAYGLVQKDLDLVIDTVDLVRLKNNPRILNRRDLQFILNVIL